jgi:Xaa-Pro aminopeptidase
MTAVTSGGHPQAPGTADLPALDVAARIGRLRELFPEAGIDALFVTRLVNIRYLTGFTGSAALLLVGPDEVLFVSDGRYKDQSADQLAAAGVEARIEISGTEQKRSRPRATSGSAWRPTGSPGRSSGASPRSGSRPPSWCRPRASSKGSAG